MLSIIIPVFVTAIQQFLRDERIRGNVFEPHGHAAYAVEIGPYSNVIYARNSADVVDVVRHVGNRCAGLPSPP